MPSLERWCVSRSTQHVVELVSEISLLSGGDILLLVSCTQIVTPAVRSTYGDTLVIHASDLPNGRGWSPLIWQILEGKQDIAVSLINAEDPVDSGAVWCKHWLHFDGTELYDEINDALFKIELDLMDFAVENAGKIKPMQQMENNATWYPRRTPDDSRIDPELSLGHQFDLLRVADPVRYPAFFDYRGTRYEITIRKHSKR